MRIGGLEEVGGRVDQHAAVIGSQSQSRTNAYSILATSLVRVCQIESGGISARGRLG